MENVTDATIVMIEDNYMHRQMYSMQFMNSGFHGFFIYPNAKDGMAAIIDKKPDLILLDVAMAEEDGMTLLRRIKENKNIADIPVIMLSNMRKQDKGKEALKLGALDYYVKAEHLPHEIVDKVKSFLSD